MHEKTKVKEIRAIKYDDSESGASGDIGFTPKASNINGLRAIRKQYLHKKLNTDFEF